MGGFHSLSPQLAGIVRFRLDWFVAFTVLLNLTLGRDASHMCSSGTHVSWAQAYKAHVRGVSPQCGIEQNHEGHEQIEPKVDNTC